VPDSDEPAEPLPDRHHPHRLSPGAYTRPGAVVFISTRARRGVLFLTPHIADAITSAMRDTTARHGLILGAYCIMPDHLHVVVTIGESNGDAAGWIQFMKREAAKRSGVPALWQRSFWDRHARDYEDVGKKVAYVLNNPVRHKLCESWEEWPYSWSKWRER
jgi:putative transposase